MAPDVRLRAVEDADVALFHQHESDPEASAMAGFPTRERERFLAHWARLRADGTKLVRTVVVDGAVAGHVGCWGQEGERLVGYWIGREHWGRGVATRALGLLLEEVGVRPVQAHVAVHNAASIRVLEANGFRRVARQGEDGDEEVVMELSG
jgi:RimJ/RimL family protein N-acetyltransferase